MNKSAAAQTLSRPVRHAGRGPLSPMNAQPHAPQAHIPDAGSQHPVRPRPAQVTTVAVAEGEALTRMGLRSILSDCPDLKVVGEAQDHRGATEIALRRRPDVMIVDLVPSMDALSLLALVRARLRDTRVIVLAARPTEELIFRALSAGASGFLLRGCDPRELVEAVRSVAAGHAALDPSVTRRLLDWVVGMDVDGLKEARALIDELGERERVVLTHMAKGMGNLGIARALYMSEGAVKAHIGRLMTKLHCSNRVQAVTIYYKANLPSYQ
jgi:DNA-binding NarL/FixJ family response regulator